MPMAKTERELTVPERRSIRKLVTGRCANYDQEYGCLPLDCECPCWVSATQTAPCAGTSGKRFCPTTRNWKQPCRLCPQNAASTAESPSRSAGGGCTAPTNAQTMPAKSRPQPECESTGAKRQCNALTPKKPCGARTFGIEFRKVAQIYSPTQNCPANGYRAQNKNQEIRK